MKFFKISLSKFNGLKGVYGSMNVSKTFEESLKEKGSIKFLKYYMDAENFEPEFITWLRGKQQCSLLVEYCKEDDYDLLVNLFLKLLYNYDFLKKKQETIPCSVIASLGFFIKSGVKPSTVEKQLRSFYDDGYILLLNKVRLGMEGVWIDPVNYFPAYYIHKNTHNGYNVLKSCFAFYDEYGVGFDCLANTYPGLIKLRTDCLFDFEPREFVRYANHSGGTMDFLIGRFNFEKGDPDSFLVLFEIFKISKEHNSAVDYARLIRTHDELLAKSLGWFCELEFRVFTKKYRKRKILTQGEP